MNDIVCYFWDFITKLCLCTWHIWIIFIFPFLIESSLLTDVAYVLCLDSLGKSDNLFLHVSKPPKEGTAGHILQQVFVK